MMRERERSRGQSTQKWEPSIFNAHFLNMNPRQRGASSSVMSDLPDSNPNKQIDIDSGEENFIALGTLKSDAFYAQHHTSAPSLMLWRR